MAHDVRPTLRISTPGEAAELIPYLVGFTPEESLVISALQNGRVEVTARVDLDAVRGAGEIEGLLDRIWDRFPDADGFAVAYTADHHTGWEVLARCDNWLPAGCQTMLIDDNTWHTPDGTSGTIDPYGKIAAQATFHGLQRLDHRSDLESRFASPPNSDELDHQLGEALAALPAPGERAQILTLTRDLIARNLPRSQPSAGEPEVQTARLNPHDAIRLAVLAQHPAARDLALLSIDRDNAPEHLALWQAVVRSSPAYGADMPLYLAGMAAWVSGDGASATVALDRIQRADPHPQSPHPSVLLEGLIDRVVPPSSWNSLRDALLADADPAISNALEAPARRRWAPIATPLGEPRPEPEVRRPPSPGIAI